mmetsp:Transcript_72218/g.165680  ORF Transcript_72218/g.165680 Transcript_72218/m.165680 type:complete len:283 (-) Transcript_72218:2500-3348(-)
MLGDSGALARSKAQTLARTPQPVDLEQQHCYKLLSTAGNRAATQNSILDRQGRDAHSVRDAFREKVVGLSGDMLRPPAAHPRQAQPSLQEILLSSVCHLELNSGDRSTQELSSHDRTYFVHKILHVQLWPGLADTMQPPLFSQQHDNHAGQPPTHVQHRKRAAKHRCSCPWQTCTNSLVRSSSEWLQRFSLFLYEIRLSAKSCSIVHRRRLVDVQIRIANFTSQSASWISYSSKSRSPSYTKSTRTSKSFDGDTISQNSSDKGLQLALDKAELLWRRVQLQN